MTGEVHFAPLLSNPILSKFRIYTHFEYDATQTFHHLVIADIMIGSWSSFSRLVQIIRNKINLWSIQVCDTNGVKLQHNGEFDTNAFKQIFERTRYIDYPMKDYDECAGMNTNE
jgi:hypothetical protein